MDTSVVSLAASGEAIFTIRLSASEDSQQCFALVASLRPDKTSTCEVLEQSQF